MYADCVLWRKGYVGTVPAYDQATNTSGGGQMSQHTRQHEIITEQTATYDWDVVNPTTAIIEVIATATDRRPREIAPLYDAVDTDALNSLFTADNAPQSVSVSFRTNDYRVTLDTTGEVSVRLVEMV